MVDKKVEAMSSDIMSPVLSHLLVITQTRIFHIYLRWHLQWSYSCKILYIKISILKLEATKVIG